MKANITVLEESAKLVVVGWFICLSVFCQRAECLLELAFPQCGKVFTMRFYMKGNEQDKDGNVRNARLRHGGCNTQKRLPLSTSTDKDEWYNAQRMKLSSRLDV